MTSLRGASAVFAIAFAAACDGGGGSLLVCTADAQCDPTGQGYNICDEAEGICLCADDRGCTPGEFCNAVGRCQVVAGCQDNDDCGSGEQGLFCDITTSQCLSVAECNPDAGESCCTLDSQCAFRQICDTLTLTCVPGCRDNADCLLGEGCAGAGFGRIGQCGLTCTADNLCPFGQLCNLSTGACELDTRGSYCLGCSGGVASDDCGDPGSYCLTDTVNGGEFCGVDCYAGEACANGYTCNDVIIIPPAAPFCSFPEACQLEPGATAGVCSRTGASCQTDEECPEGPPGSDCFARTGRNGSCATNPNIDCTFDTDCPSGECIRIECRGSEGDTFGNCSCTRDSDCPRDDCVGGDLSNPDAPVKGYCRLSGHDCYEDADCDIIACVGGGCLIGKNCAPSDGRTCSDLLAPAQAP